MQTSSESPISLRVENVSKQYRLGSGQSSLRELFVTSGRRLLNRGDRDESQYFWALRNMSFDVERGEALGIIGANGAGKTTTLKLLSHITEPTEGKIALLGRFSSLIELGAGFHPELTGRENIYLNGVILGLTRQQVKQRFDEIVAFSELDHFIDMPVKRYSSGMFARLGFAVAAHVDPDIMLVDEVLAVGDVSFQQKCYDFLHRFVKSGKTTVFVSHNLYVIEQLCDRVIWLDHGQVMMNDKPSCVLSGYLDSQEKRILQQSTAAGDEANQQMRIDKIDFLDADDNPRDTFAPGEDLVMRVRYTAGEEIPEPHFVLSISDAQGGPPLIIASMLADNAAPKMVQGKGELLCHFRNIPLRPRAYLVWGEVWGADRARLLVNWQRFSAFRIVDSNRDVDFANRGSLRHSRIDGPIMVPYEWEYS